MAIPFRAGRYCLVQAPAFRSGVMAAEDMIEGECMSTTRSITLALAAAAALATPLLAGATANAQDRPVAGRQAIAPPPTTQRM